MGLGQMMLSVFALALLGTVILMMNNTVMDSGSAIETTEYMIMATSLGISQIESASGKAFDENTVSSDIASPSALTVNGDTVNFRSANFFIRDSVDYVTVTGNTVTSSSARTYHKRLRVWVSSPFMKDTLTFSSVYSYWYFR